MTSEWGRGTVPLGQKGCLAWPPVPAHGMVTALCPCRFAPSLRQLKQQAFLLHVPPTLPSRLVQRLQEVSRAGRVARGCVNQFGWENGALCWSLFPTVPSNIEPSGYLQLTLILSACGGQSGEDGAGHRDLLGTGGIVHLFLGSRAVVLGWALWMCWTGRVPLSSV